MWRVSVCVCVCVFEKKGGDGRRTWNGRKQGGQRTWGDETFERGIVGDDRVGEDERARRDVEDVGRRRGGGARGEDDLCKVGRDGDVGWRANDFIILCFGHRSDMSDPG